MDNLPHPFRDILLHNAVFLPIIFGFIFLKRLEKERKVFLYYLLIGQVAEMIKGINPSTFTVRTTSLLFTALATPLLYFVMLGFSGSRKKFYLLYTLNVLVVLLDFVFFYKKQPQVPLSKILVFAAVVYFSINAFVNTTSRTLEKKELLSRLLIIVPVLVFFLYQMLINILMFFLFKAETKTLFLELYSIVMYIGFVCALAYMAAFCFSPKKEIYLE